MAGRFKLAKTEKNNTAKEKNRKEKSKPKKMAKSVQEVLDFSGITEDGILISKSGRHYSKLYRLVDSNFITEPEENQYTIISTYAKLVSKFPDHVDISIVILNKRNTEKSLTDAYHLKSQGNELDSYRDDYNKIIDVKIKEGRNDISKEKYIMLTVRKDSLSEAELDFTAIDVSLNDAVKAINKVGVKQLNALERLKVMREILCGSKGIPFEQEFGKYFETHHDGEGNTTTNISTGLLKKAGVSVKDLIAPQCFAKDKQLLMLDEDRYCKSFAYINLPQSLDTSFLTSSTNLPYEMSTVIQLKTVPRKKALNLVKMQNTSIKADVIKASQTAYKNGYDPSLMNEDLVQAREQSAQLREDIVRGGKKLFYATMVVTIFGETEEEIELISTQYKSKCTDFSVTPSYLIGQQVPALNTTCLCGQSEVTIDRMLTSDNACALFPFNNQELQDKKGHFYGINAISKNMIMYDRKRSRLANGMIFGQSGSGKSFFTKGEIIPNILDGNDDIIILDPENEYRVIANELGGVVIDLALKSDFHINPCDMSMEWDDPKATPLAEKCDYMVSLVESIMGKGRQCNIYEINCIHRACNKMYAEYIEEMTSRHDDGDTADIDMELCPTLVDFYNILRADEAPDAQKIANTVEQYAIGNYNVFAHKTNVRTGDKLTVFNLLYLPENMKEMAMKVCLSDIWRRVVKNKELNEQNGTNKSIWVYLDEFHLFFQSEASANTIQAYYKRVRKYGGIMTGITQDVADLLRTPQGTAMFNNTGFFVFLNQLQLGRDAIQRLFTVSDNLIDYIKDKPSGMGLVFNGSVMIPMDYKLPTSSTLYKIMSTNPNDENKLKKKNSKPETDEQVNLKK